MTAALPENIMWAILIWMIPMIVPILFMYLDSVDFKMFMLAFIYPLMLSILSRSGRFWLKRSVILMSSITTFTATYFMMKYDKNREAIQKPTENKSRSALIFTAIMVAFALGIVLAGTFETLYNGQ
jgi:hypothetical protein